MEAIPSVNPDESKNPAPGQGSLAYIAESLRPLAVPIGSLNPDPANARTHDERNLQAIAASLSRFGQRAPVVVQKQGMIVRAGNGRLQAAKSLGWQHLAAVVVDEASVDATAFAIADNRTAELAGWDDETLASLLQSLPEDMRDVSGFNDDDLGELLNKLAPEVVEDEAPEPLPDPVSKTGDLWILGEHRLLCGDSTHAGDVLRVLDGDKIELCFTSPPYASQRTYDESSGFKPIPPSSYVEWWGRVQEQIKPNMAPSASLFVNIKEAADEGQKQDYVKRLALSHIDSWGWMWIEEYVWPRPAMPLDPNSSRRFKNGWESVYHFAVDRNFTFHPDRVRHESDGCFSYSDQKKAGKKICDGSQGVGGGTMSPVNQFTGLAYPSNVLPNFGGANVVGHSAAFPVGLPTFFVECFSEPASVVFEPFSGSGTTIVACENTNRRCRAIELSGQYVDLAIRRWEKLTGKHATHEATGKTWAETAQDRGVSVE